MLDPSARSKHLLLVSDFDQTLSFNDSGLVLSQMIGASGFEEKVAAHSQKRSELMWSPILQLRRSLGGQRPR